MPGRLRNFAVAFVALALAGCLFGRPVVKVERIPCPPQALDVESPVTGKARNGETIEDYEDRVAADDAISAAAVQAWREAHGECAESD